MAGAVSDLAEPHPYDALDLDQLRRRRSLKWRAYPPDVLPCWVAETDFPLAEPIATALTEMVGRSDTGYAAFDGLAEAFAGFSERRYGVAVDPALCYPLQDIMRGVLLALQSLTEPGGSVVVCPPVYPPFFSTIRYAGRAVVEVPLARDGDSGHYHLDLDGLRSAFADGAQALLLCNPHNPVGRSWTRAELTGVAELAERHGVVVLSDEVHGPLTFSGTEHTPFGSLGTPAVSRSVTLVSASKAFNVPGLKCALLLAGSADVLRAFEAVPQEVPFGASIFGVAANIAAFTAGDSWLDQTLTYLERNRDTLGRLLAKALPEVTWSPPQATYLGWLDCRGLGLGDDPAAAFLAGGRVALDSGPRFGAAGRGFTRFNFATSTALVTEAVERMATAVAAGVQG
jgi:cysteine-S-conjugate beta-lyase